MKVWRAQKLTSLIKASEQAGKVVSKARVTADGAILLEYANDKAPTNPADLVDMSE